MPERDTRGARGRAAAGGRETTRVVEGEVLLERAVGETTLAVAQEPEAVSLLRPQQGRNVVWRWHVRRRQRAR